MSVYSALILSEASLISLWEVDETGTPTGPAGIDAKGTNNGTYSGTFTLGLSGIPGTAGGTSFGIAGAALVVASPTATVPTTGAYSLECWVLIQSGTTISGDRGVMGYGTYGSSNKVNALKFTSTTVMVNYWWGNDQTWTLPQSIADGVWHHLVATWDGSFRAFYFDGVAVAAHVAATGLNADSTNITLGATGTGGGEIFPTHAGTPNRLDEVAIYGTALSPTAVLDHYNAGITLSSTYSYNPVGIGGGLIGKMGSLVG